MTTTRFTATSRLLHWLMAVLILAMLFIGVGMAASETPRYETLVAMHKPLGSCYWFWWRSGWSIG